MRLQCSLLLVVTVMSGSSMACDPDATDSTSDGSLPPASSYDGGADGGGGIHFPPVGDAGENGFPVDASRDGGLGPVSDATTPIDAGGGQGDGSVDASGDGHIREDAPTVATASKAGTYTVANTTAGLRDGPDYADATLYYPTDAEPPFAFVSVVPGFVSVQAQIQNWGPFLASHGIVTITIGTNGLGDQPDVRAKALVDALKTVEAENAREGSPLKGKLDLTRQGTVGWSMGGGGSLLAAEATPSLKAAISLCGWNPDYKYTKDTVPVMMLAAKGDSLAGGQSQGFYDSVPNSTPKFLWESSNTSAFFGGHDTFNDPANLNGADGLYGLSWLKVFLEGDDRYRQFLKQEPPTATDYKTNVM